MEKSKGADLPERKMKREEAIEKFAIDKLRKLSNEERAEQLEIMILEDWSESKDWNLLSNEIIDEFERGELKDNPSSPKYDHLLLIWLKNSLMGVSNEFLCKNLDIDLIEGEPLKLSPCPCCGSRTIGEIGNYEICVVCWWEDDGQDNENADEIGGANNGISLTQARYNFIKHGIYDPKRKDLVKLQEPTDKYEKGREFEVVGDFVKEPGTNWKGNIKTKI
jgi:hypothetical protein